MSELNWYIVDNCVDDIWCDKIGDATMSAEAVKDRLDYEWNKLTKHDKARRYEFYAALAEHDTFGMRFDRIKAEIHID